MFGNNLAASPQSANPPSGPLFRPPVAQPIVFAPDYATPLKTIAPTLIASAFPLNVRECAVPGYSHLSAGTIQIQPPSGAAVTINPAATSDGVFTGSSYPGDLWSRGLCDFWK